MRAAVLSDGKFTVENLPAPSPGPGQILVRPLVCGICGSDLHTRHHARHLGALFQRAGFPGLADGKKIRIVLIPVFEGLSDLIIGGELTAGWRLDQTPNRRSEIRSVQVGVVPSFDGIAAGGDPSAEVVILHMMRRSQCVFDDHIPLSVRANSTGAQPIRQSQTGGGLKPGEAIGQRSDPVPQTASPGLVVQGQGM